MKSISVPSAAQVSTTTRFLNTCNLKTLGALHKQLRDMLDIMLTEHDMLQYVAK